MREFACLAAVVVLIGACGGSEDADATGTSAAETTSSAPSTTSESTTSPPTTTSTTPEAATPPTRPETTGMDSPPPADDELARIVQESIDDLAARLSVDAADITVVREEAATWPDGNLGCPQLEGSDSEGEVEGYQVILEHENRVYIYHAAADGDPFLCPSEEKDGGHEFVPPPGIDE